MKIAKSYVRLTMAHVFPALHKPAGYVSFYKIFRLLRVKCVFVSVSSRDYDHKVIEILSLPIEITIDAVYINRHPFV